MYEVIKEAKHINKGDYLKITQYDERYRSHVINYVIAKKKLDEKSWECKVVRVTDTEGKILHQTKLHRDPLEESDDELHLTICIDPIYIHFFDDDFLVQRLTYQEWISEIV